MPPHLLWEGLGRGTTLYADLFASQAPLTDEQMLAEDAMLAMTTEEVRKRAVNDLNKEFLAADFQI